MKITSLTAGKALVRIACMTLAFAFPLSWVGFNVAGGMGAALVLAIASFGLFALTRKLTGGVLGIAPESCPTGRSTTAKLIAFVVGSSIVQVALFALLPFVTVASWWSIPAGGLLLLVCAVVSNLPTKLMDAIAGDTAK